jgi:hydroxyacylglutathione hydrolase
MTLDGTRNYLVGGGRSVLLDPGPSGEGQRKRVRRLAEGRRVTTVALTHAHPDHAGGAAEVAGELGVPLAASSETLRRLGVEGRAVAGGDVLPVDPPSGDGPDADDDGAGAGLRVLETPGHSADHLAFWWPVRRALFTGDLVLGSGSAMVGHPDGHMGDYLASLERLAALRPRRIYPGHGDPVDEPVARLAAYRDHRLEREARVRRALEEGARSVEEVRRRAYDELPAALEPAADASVRAHLVHLREEGFDLPETAGL